MLCLNLVDIYCVLKRTLRVQAAVMSVLLYGCTKWTLTRCIEKKLDGNRTRMLRTIFNKPWKQHPVTQQLYDYQSPISKTIQIRRTRHARSKDELINDVFLWTPSQGRAGVGRPTRTFLQQLCTDTAYSLEDLWEAMDDRDG